MQSRGRPITISDEELLAFARTVFLERGAEATTAEIAKRARISESVIFHRFKTKAAFFRALVERELSVPERVRTLPERAGKGVIADELFDAIMAMIDVARVVMPFVMAAAAQPSGFGQVHELTKGHPSRRQTHEALARYFELEIKKGRLRRVDVVALTTTVLGLVTQLVLDARDGIAQVDTPKHVRNALDILLHGALVPKPR